MTEIRLPMSPIASIACWFQKPAVLMAIGMKMCVAAIAAAYFIIINIVVNFSVRCCRHAEDPATAHWIRDKLFATKTVFYVSYSINFILYSLAGANYRNAVAALCHPCCPNSGRFQTAASRRTTPGLARRLSGSTMGPSSESGSAACAAIAVEPRQIAVSAV